MMRSPVSLAVAGYVSSALLTLRSAQRSDRVSRVSEQLKELYGPLLACVTASSSSYDAMVRQVGGAEGISGAAFRKLVREDRTSKAARHHRVWVREVLMPLSEKAARLVVERADLLESSRIEPLLLQLVAHVSAYKVILKQWEAGDASQHSVVPYPDGIHTFVEREFGKLKRRQADMLGIDRSGNYVSLVPSILRELSRMFTSYGRSRL